MGEREQETELWMMQRSIPKNTAYQQWIEFLLPWLIRIVNLAEFAMAYAAVNYLNISKNLKADHPGLEMKKW